MTKKFMYNLVAPIFLFILLLFIGGCNLHGEEEPVDEPDTPEASIPITLTQGQVTPTTGTVTTQFAYRLTYSDSVDNIPSKIEVYIDGAANTMTKAFETQTSKTFEYETALALGNHEYYFLCEDGNGNTARLPETGFYTGPTVTQATYNLSGTMSYTGSHFTFGTSSISFSCVGQSPSNFYPSAIMVKTLPIDRDLAPDFYAVYIIVDVDGDSPDFYDDPMFIYDNVIDMNNPTLIDMTASDQSVDFIFGDENKYGFQTQLTFGLLPSDWVDPDSNYVIDSGQYVMNGGSSDDYAIAYFNQNIENFTLHCYGLHDLGVNDAEWGFFFHADLLLTQGFAVTVDSIGDWTLSTVTGTPIAGGSGFTSGESVRISFINNTISILIDGSQVYSNDVSATYPYNSGYMGIYTQDDTTNPPIVAFDDLWMIMHE